MKEQTVCVSEFHEYETEQQVSLLSRSPVNSGARAGLSHFRSLHACLKAFISVVRSSRQAACMHPKLVTRRICDENKKEKTPERWAACKRLHLYKSESFGGVQTRVTQQE